MVRRTAYHKGTKVPKHGKTRKVDMSDQLLLALRDLRKAAKALALKKGRGVPEFVFTTHLGTLLDASWVRKVFTDSLKAAGLRVIPFHALRHSFASALIGNGSSLTYVRDQMGHSSIQITVDTYGHLVPGSNRNALNRLDNLCKTAIQAQPAVSGG